MEFYILGNEWRCEHKQVLWWGYGGGAGSAGSWYSSTNDMMVLIRLLWPWNTAQGYAAGNFLLNSLYPNLGATCEIIMFMDIQSCRILLKCYQFLILTCNVFLKWWSFAGYNPPEGCERIEILNIMCFCFINCPNI